MLQRRTSKVEGITELHVPSEELVKKTGYSADRLRKAQVLPQNCIFGYRLVVADVASVDRIAFEAIGVVVSVANSDVIDSTWQRFFQFGSGEPNVENLFRAYSDYTKRDKSKSVSYLPAGEILLPF